MSNRKSDSPDSISSDGLDLSLEDTRSQKMRGVPVKSRTGVTGYNPYDAIPAGKPKEAPRKPTDLRKLSEWIRMQRQVSDLKKQES